jgi:hypothetical protein
MVGLSRLSDGWAYYEIRKPENFYNLFEPETKQVFVVDDAFGSTEFHPDLAKEWESELDIILGKLDKTHWLIWTSRAEPLKKAISRMRLQGKAQSFPEPAKIIIDAKDLTPKEKALILYRHAKNAKLSPNEKRPRKI